MFDIGSIPMAAHCIDAKVDLAVSRTFYLWHFEAKIFTKIEFIFICGIRIEITVLYLKPGLRKTRYNCHKYSFTKFLDTSLGKRNFRH